MKLLTALIVTGFYIGLKRYFPAEAETLVDKRGNAHFGDTMVTKTKKRIMNRNDVVPMEMAITGLKYCIRMVVMSYTLLV